MLEGFLTGLIGGVVSPGCEGGKSSQLLWDFLCGEDDRTFHDGMTSIVEGDGGMEKISKTAY